MRRKKLFDLNIGKREEKKTSPWSFCSDIELKATGRGEKG